MHKIPGRVLSVFARVGVTALVAGLMIFSAERGALANPKYAGIVIDAKTGEVLYNEDGDAQRYPASLTKMMTLYLVFEALDQGRITMNSKVTFSANAAAEPPTKLGVGTGRSVTVEQAIYALVTRSANDAATALGEMLAGSETRFAQVMTAKARSLGMSRTTYRNAHGLPNSGQVTTARDQARLSIALRQHFPQYYGVFSARSFKFGKQTISNHNRLLGTVRGVDGIKTGYTRASGYNLATSAQAGGRSIVAVVLGARSGASRNAHMTNLVERYLPQASRSGSGNLIAKKASPATPDIGTASAFSLPTTGPVPDVRFNGVQASAYAETVTNSVPTPMQAVAPAATPALAPPAPIAVTDRMPTGSIPAANTPDIDSVTTASTSTPTGWIVQVGTSPEQSSAMDLLRAAQDKGGKVLRSATPFTVAYNTGSAQVYRARFGGFADQDAAVNACKALKKKGIGCWAAAQ